MAKEKTVILVRNTREFVHCWPNAPEEVFYLRSLHRHVLHIETEIEVFSDDRELEFIMVKHCINHFLETTTWGPTTSCEVIAKAVAQFIRESYGDRNVSVTVYEDGENGAKYIYTKE